MSKTMSNQKLDFNNLVVIITGAGGGLGRVYALEYAKRGAKIVVNDLGAPEQVVLEIQRMGGIAVADKHSCEQGTEIVQTALKAFGRVDILINNAGILRDSSFIKMTEQQWQQVLDVHLHGSFKMTKACWDIFNKQKFGRIINTASAAGIYGNYGQANYSAAKLGLHGFTLSLSKEGERNNVLVNTIAPIAKSKMTESVLPPDVLANLKPEFVAPLVLYLTHPSVTENGSLFEVGAGFIAKVRWSRSQGQLFKLDSTFTPSAVLDKLDQIHNMSNPQSPSSMADLNPLSYLEACKSITNPKGPAINLKDKVVIVTGAGNGLGRQYALLFAYLKCNVVVNDLGGNTHGVGNSTNAAEKVVQDIISKGGSAIPNYNSVVDGQMVVESAIKKWGRVDILINNAGILRDVSMSKMTAEDWLLIHKVHLNGTFAMCHAAWPYMVKQKYGRIINTSSSIALYGNFGSCNYGSAKSAIIGFSKTLAIEGKSKNITVNVVIPTAGTRITSTIMPNDVLEQLKPEYVSPLVVALTSTSITNKVYEAGCGIVQSCEWQRSKGVGFKSVDVEDVYNKWREITDFSKYHHPGSVQESYQEIFNNFSNLSSPKSSNSKASSVGSSHSYSYNQADIILYNISLNCTATQLHYIYEQSDSFQIIPTFINSAIVHSATVFPFDSICNDFSLMNLVHGEQLVKLNLPLLVEDVIQFESSVGSIKSIKNSLVIRLIVKGSNKRGQIVHGEITLFIRNCSVKQGIQSANIPSIGVSTDVLTRVMSRQPDKVIINKTTDNQALLFRASSKDLNPMHIDSSFAKMGGFDKPILHGMCTFGICGKSIMDAYGPFNMIMGRLSKHVYPGETLVVEMWLEGDLVVFVCKCKERNEIVVMNACAKLEKTKAGATSKAASTTASKSSAVLSKLDAYLQGMQADQKKKYQSKGGVFQLEISTPNNKEEWVIDLKELKIVQGNRKNDCLIKIGDEDFIKMASGKISGQEAFMSGKLKASGNIMMSMVLGDLLGGLRGKL
eukprot:NODE_24_length_36516_cov_0.652470.p3 type:complete len:1011 gc:universal NODE_24_length_36516_cov_0.652470:22636-19604(-)